VIIATDRPKRPTDFTRQPVAPPSSRFCPFCYGNEKKSPPEVLAYRPGGQPNDSGWLLRVVPNKFPVLQVEGDLNRQGEGLFDKMNGIGAHEVIIESPDHALAFTDMSEQQIEKVFWACRDRVLDLKRDRRLVYIALFKNFGDAAGASIEHSHSQLVALPIIPKHAKEELAGAKEYFDYRERCIFCDIIQQECQSGVRLVTETDRFAVIEPFAPRFPFETWILPKQHSSHFEDIDPPTVQNLAWVMRSTLRKIDKVLEHPAYNFVIHTSPIQEGPVLHYHWHIEIMPKLTRLAGFESGTGFYINPTPPEESAKFLRETGLV